MRFQICKNHFFCIEFKCMVCMLTVVPDTMLGWRTETWTGVEKSVRIKRHCCLRLFSHLRIFNFLIKSFKQSSTSHTKRNIHNADHKIGQASNGVQLESTTLQKPIKPLHCKKLKRILKHLTVKFYKRRFRPFKFRWTVIFVCMILLVHSVTRLYLWTGMCKICVSVGETSKITSWKLENVVLTILSGHICQKKCIAIL